MRKNKVNKIVTNLVRLSLILIFIGNFFINKHSQDFLIY